MQECVGTRWIGRIGKFGPDISFVTEEDAKKWEYANGGLPATTFVSIAPIPEISMRDNANED